MVKDNQEISGELGVEIVWGKQTRSLIISYPHSIGGVVC